ncbi:MAG: response regulator transcription factor [Gammaproteobacteria bacterium]|nr:response regulator transcription factor [Gammaproteobacteria bacterium]
MRLLLVEDESQIAANLKKFLHQHGFVVDVAENLRIAWESVQSIDYPLAILDRRLPDGDGVELIRKSRRLKKVPRFLVLSALGDVDDKVHGLNLGANDYMAKPFDPKELLARVEAMLRTPRARSQGCVTVGNLTYDRGARVFSVGGQGLDLRRREMEVLEVLITRTQQIVSRDELFDRLYGFDSIPAANTLDSHISRLRTRLAATRAGVVIRTARNLGYILQQDDVGKLK